MLSFRRGTVSRLRQADRRNCSTHPKHPVCAQQTENRHGNVGGY
jgi:hypothetical protein